MEVQAGTGTRLTAVLAALGLVASCGSSGGRPDDELAGLVEPERREQPPIDLDRAATEPAELLRAALQPHRTVAAALGAHTFAGTSSVVVTEDGKTVEDLRDETAIQYREGGDFHAVLANSKDYGREVYYLGGTLYVGARHQKFSKRPPADDHEPARVADEIAGALGANFELVAHAAEVSDRGIAQVAGRPARTIVFKLAPGEHRPPAQSLPQRAWRESIAVSALEGQVSLDAETGVPLAAELEATLGFTRDGRRFQMKVSATHAIADIGAAPTIEPPPDERVVVVADHHREAMEREDLLRGIAPPARKAPTPGNTSGTP